MNYNKDVCDFPMTKSSLRELVAQPYRFARRYIRHRQTANTLRVPPPPPQQQSFSGAVLVFAPEADVTPHIALMSIMAKALIDSGQPAVSIRCFQIYKRCPVMGSRGLANPTPDKERRIACLDCGYASLHLLPQYNLPTLDLRSYLTPAMRKKIAAEMSNLPDLLREYTYDGIAFGKLTMMDLATARKVSDYDNVSPENRAVWISFLESSLTSYLLADSLMQQQKFKAVIHYNDISLMLGARLAARKYGIPGYCVTHASHKNIDRRRAHIRPQIGLLADRANSEVWPEWSRQALSEPEVREIGDDIIFRFRSQGSHQYAMTKSFTCEDLRTKLGLSHERKLIVAYTSSLDELLASKMSAEGAAEVFTIPPQPFEDQIEWLRALVQFVEQSNDKSLVIRIHPREGATRRNNAISDHLRRLRIELDGKYENCRIIWPEDKTSSYDLAEIADLGLISWSTIGIELARLGIPVVASTLGIGSFPRASFLEWGATPEEYFQQIQLNLSRQPEINSVVGAFRWYNLNHLGTTVDLSDVIPDAQNTSFPPYKRLREKETIRQVISGERSILDINLQRLKDAQTPQSEDLERAAIKQELRRIIHFNFTGEDSVEDRGLKVMDQLSNPDSNIQADPSDKTPQLIILKDAVQYIYNGSTLTKYSPMVRRLALLCGTSIEPGKGD